MARAGRPALALLWLGLASLHLVEGKLVTGSARLGGSEEQDKWRYLSKFGYAIGIGTYDVRVRLRQPLPDGEKARVHVDVFLDEDWDYAESLPPCSRASDGAARETHRIALDQTGEWSPWFGGALAQSIRPHIWYFALSRCTDAGNRMTELDYELSMRQFDESELSVEVRYMPIVTVAALLCLTGFLARFASRCRGLCRSMGNVHPVIQTLAASVALQWLAQVSHSLHFLLYSQDGVGSAAVEAVAEVLFMVSQVLSSTLLIIIAQGYTLTRSSGCGLDLVRHVAVAVAILHVVLVGHGKLQGEASYKYHGNEGAIGWTLLAVRLLLFAWFAVGLQSLKRKGGFRLQCFLKSFQLAGSLYFLAYPAIFVVAQLFAPYLQHPVMQIGLVAMQTASAFWLAHLFLSRGAYFEVSTLSACLLPGGKSGVPTLLYKDD